MDTAEALTRADENMFESFRVMCAGIPGGEVLERDGVLITASGLPAAMFNVAFVTRPLPEPRAALEPAVAYFDDRRLPFVLRIRAGYDDPGEEAAKELGLVLGEIAPGMVLDNPRKRLKRPGKLDIREATTEAEREDFAFVAARGFGAPLTMTRALVGFARHGQVDSELYVGYLEGQPVASSTLILSHRVAGVYNVATLPSVRRHGHGEAMTAHAVRRGAELGAVMASLQASDMGRPVYEHMGFRVTAWYRNFRRP